MNDSSQPPITREPPANPNPQPNYHVPHAIENLSLQPNNWVRWGLINITGFVVAVCLFSFLVVFEMIIAINIFGYEPSLGSSLAGYQTSILNLTILGLCAAFTAAVVALVQRAAFNYQVSHWRWVAKTALTVGLLFPISIVLANFVGNKIFLDAKSWLMYSCYMVISFGITSLGTALAQMTEVKSLVNQPIEWVFVSSLTWTLLSVFITGSIINLMRGIM